MIVRGGAGDCADYNPKLRGALARSERASIGGVTNVAPGTGVSGTGDARSHKRSAA